MKDNRGRNRLRICFILPTRGITHGGLETLADHFAAGLAQRGHSVVLLIGAAPGWPRRSDVPRGVEPVVIPFLHRTSISLRVLARLTRQKPLHLQSLNFFLSSLVNSQARHCLAQCDLAVTFMEGEAVLYSRWLSRRAIPSIYYFAGGIDTRWAQRDRSLRIANTHTIARDALERHGFETHAVLTPGVDPALLQIPRSLNSGESPFRLLYVGRLVPVKNVDRLLPIVRTLAPEFPGIILEIVGDGVMRSQLERTVRAEGLTQHIIFRGALGGEPLRQAFGRADLFLFPSSHEGFGTAAFEAMAAGVPVVASDLPGLRESTDGHACLLPPDDTAAWIDSIRKLLRAPRLREEMARAGREWVAPFTWDRVVDQFEVIVYQATERT